MNCKKHILLFAILIFGYGCLALGLKSTAFSSSNRKANVSNSALSASKQILKSTEAGYAVLDDNETEQDQSQKLILDLGIVPDFNFSFKTVSLPNKSAKTVSLNNPFSYRGKHLYILFHKWKFLHF